ncbi:hypothetical protein ACFT9I_06000 [Streptomyces sp. NPDC057137]|uniref:hypothetical protein n=1 Tax=Streptomyces sp. NPDC057137 TaxID=3346030 RepID=UPI0036302647
MPSPQTLRSRGVTATFHGDTVVIERAEERATIPLRVIRSVRAAEGRSRTVEITLADSAVHTIAANNSTAATAFVTAVGAALPPTPDERGSALVRTEPLAATPRLFSSRLTLALFTATVVAYLAYLGYIAVVHTPWAIFSAVVGLLPLGLGLVTAGLTVRHLYIKAVLRRRGVIVQAVDTGMSGKKSVYTFTDAEGNAHEYRSGLHADTIEVAYDPRNPERKASVTPLLLEVPRVLLMVLLAGGFTLLGAISVLSPVLP